MFVDKHQKLTHETVGSYSQISSFSFDKEIFTLPFSKVASQETCVTGQSLENQSWSSHANILSKNDEDTEKEGEIIKDFYTYFDSQLHFS